MPLTREDDLLSAADQLLRCLAQLRMAAASGANTGRVVQLMEEWKSEAEDAVRDTEALEGDDPYMDGNEDAMMLDVLSRIAAYLKNQQR